MKLINAIFIISCSILTGCMSSPKRDMASQESESRSVFESLRERAEQAEIVDSVAHLDESVRVASESQRTTYTDRIQKAVTLDLLKYIDRAIEDAKNARDGYLSFIGDTKRTPEEISAMVSVPAVAILALTANRFINIRVRVFSKWRSVERKVVARKNPSIHSAYAFDPKHSKPIYGWVGEKKKWTRRMPSNLMRHALLISGFVFLETAANEGLQTILFTETEAEQLQQVVKEEKEKLEKELL